MTVTLISNWYEVYRKSGGGGIDLLYNTVKIKLCICKQCMQTYVMCHVIVFVMQYITKYLFNNLCHVVFTIQYITKYLFNNLCHVVFIIQYITKYLFNNLCHVVFTILVLQRQRAHHIFSVKFLKDQHHMVVIVISLEQTHNMFLSDCLQLIQFNNLFR